MIWIGIIILVLLVVTFWVLLKSRNLNLWIYAYVRQKFLHRRLEPKMHQHVYICIADHFEPYYGNASHEEARELVSRWVTGYCEMAARHEDSNGRPPQHSYFYPVEEYDEWILREIKKICDQDLGDVDIHLHHEDDTAESLAQTLNGFKEILYHRHGLLRKDERGEIVYGFIHGNWALDNSRPDGKWCGVDDEIDVLLDTGCVFDMTMPSAPSDTQTSTINSIYFASENGQPKSHDRGRQARRGGWRDDRELVMIQGPLTLNWKSRKFGIMPRIENGEISSDMPPSSQRIRLWRDCAISVQGCENHIFVKLYTHGLQRQNLDLFFDGGGLDALYSGLELEFGRREDVSLHYVTAWEMYRKIKTLCEGEAQAQDWSHG